MANRDLAERWRKWRRRRPHALRRLGRDVVWVNYINSGHGTPHTSETDYRDFHTRILAWFDKYLKTAPASMDK